MIEPQFSSFVKSLCLDYTPLELSLVWLHEMIWANEFDFLPVYFMVNFLFYCVLLQKEFEYYFFENKLFWRIVRRLVLNQIHIQLLAAFFFVY